VKIEDRSEAYEVSTMNENRRYERKIRNLMSVSNMVHPVGVVPQTPETATGQKTNRCLLKIVSRFYPPIRLLQVMWEPSSDERFLV